MSVYISCGCRPWAKEGALFSFTCPAGFSSSCNFFFFFYQNKGGPSRPPPLDPPPYNFLWHMWSICSFIVIFLSIFMCIWSYLHVNLHRKNNIYYHRKHYYNYYYCHYYYFILSCTSKHVSSASYSCYPLPPLCFWSVPRVWKDLA